ncbi:MAG: S-layer homology domain-containing protein, partial [bacterium]
RAIAIALAFCLAFTLAEGAFADYAGVPGGINLSAVAQELADGTYDVSYSASLYMPASLARAAAAASNAGRLGKLTFVCVLDDEIVRAQLTASPVTQSDFTMTGEGSEFYELVSCQKSDAGNLELTYKLKAEVVANWNNESAASKAEKLQKQVVFTSVTKNLPATAIPTNKDIETKATVTINGLKDPESSLLAAVGITHMSIGKYVAAVDLDISGGTVSLENSENTAGTRVYFNTLPANGKRVVEVRIVGEDGRVIPVTLQALNEYSFLMPDENVTIYVTFDDGAALPEESGVDTKLETEEHIVYMEGYPDGTFLPNREMTRAEVAMMLSRLVKDSGNAGKTFSDVPANAWYAEAVGKIAGLGVVAGYPDGTFHPNQSITRAEFATMIVRLAKVSVEPTVPSFEDVEPESWAYPYVETAAKLGWIVGHEGNFSPKNALTRAEAVTIMNRVLGRPIDKAAIDAGRGFRFPDVAAGNWAFYNIVEATTAHEAVVNADTYTETWQN